MRLNLGPISNVLGALMVMLGIMMLTALPFSLYFESGDHLAILISFGITVTIGGAFWAYKFKSKPDITKRDGYVVVLLGWIFMVLCCMLPYLFAGTHTSFADAFFEAASGTTTTGASVINDIEASLRVFSFGEVLRSG